ncbi:MAG: response regulator [candidate division Zixibacteria bacterium CG_4_9_14_3_um_filter_46_8]|nr:MAG: response regulator [candidate division Zixibacteria bacterium CG_4_9_14_3_um_filter_46_8]
MAFNILLVDDSKAIRSIIIKTLRLTKLDIDQIYEAANGKEALDVLLNNWIDLVLSDINMPVMTGIELVEEMAKDDLLKTIPVIIISTDGSTTRMDQLKSKGIKEYLRKPFLPESVGEKIDKVLGVKHE